MQSLQNWPFVKGSARLPSIECIGGLPGCYQEAVEIAGPPGSGPSLTFVPMLEAKRVKNRLCLDVNPVGCDQEQEVERLIGLGARRIDIGQGEQS